MDWLVAVGMGILLGVVGGLLLRCVVGCFASVSMGLSVWGSLIVRRCFEWTDDCFEIDRLTACAVEFLIGRGRPGS